MNTDMVSGNNDRLYITSILQKALSVNPLNEKYSSKAVLNDKTIDTALKDYAAKSSPI